MLELNTQLRLTVTQALDHAFLDIVPAIPTTAGSPKNGTAAKTRIGATDEIANDFRYVSHVLLDLPAMTGQPRQSDLFF